jgi:hypothetical protein
MAAVGETLSYLQRNLPCHAFMGLAIERFEPSDIEQEFGKL